MKTFEQAMVLTNTISSEMNFSQEECKAFWDLLLQVPKGGTIVEIGCHLGRSSSLILQVARDVGFLSIHVDPWTTGEVAQWSQMAHLTGTDHVVLKMRSAEALALPWLAGVPLDLVFIDGDHETPGVVIDCNWGERVRSGGILCCHDYGRDYLSGVEITMRNYTSNPRWQKIGVFGTLAAWRRI